MHTLAVLRHTNCFSLRQISCKSRLRRQHCPGPPGRRDGRQADRARGRGGGGGGRGYERSMYQRRLGAGWRRRERGGGAIPWEWKEMVREKKAPTLQECLTLSLCLSIAQAECPPTSYTPTLRSPTAAPLLQRSIPHPPSSTSSQISTLPPCLPLLSLSHSLSLHRSTEKWRKDETLQRGKKINNTDG